MFETPNQEKYTKLYRRLINRAWFRKNPEGEYLEKHHVVPRCIYEQPGSVNDITVKLKPDEHYLAHQLLVKMFPDNYKLAYAANMMCTNRPENEPFGWIREKVAEAARIENTGKKQSPETVAKRIQTRRDNGIDGVAYVWNKGVKMTPEQTKNMQGREPWNKGIPRTEECIQKVKETKAKNGVSEAQRACIENRTEEHKQNLILAAKKPKSEEHKAKLAAANKGTSPPNKGKKRVFNETTQKYQYI